MTSDTPEIPPGHIDLRPLKPLCREYRQIFEFIAGGGQIPLEYAYVGQHPATSALNRREVHGIRSDRGSSLGITLGTEPLKPGDKAITFILGTHPNELSAWEAAKTIIEAWNDGTIPHDLKINLVIGGAKNGVTEKDASGKEKLNIRVCGHHSDPSRKGGVRGMFKAIETKNSMSIGEYTEYRSSPHNWNRVMLEKELAKLDPRITDLSKYDAAPEMKHVIERREQLKKHAYTHSHAIMDFHSLSQYSPPLVLLQTQWANADIALALIQKHPNVLSPSPLTPNILTEMLDTYAPGVSSMPLLNSDPDGALSLCIETGGPHWDLTTIKSGGKLAMHLLRGLANEIRPGCMAPTHFTEEELAAFRASEAKGIYRKPLGLFHPKFQPDDAVRVQYKAAAAEQHIDWKKAQEDTYILVRGNLERPFNKEVADQLVEKQRSRTDKTIPTLNRQEIHNYLYALPGKLRAYHRAHNIPPTTKAHLGTLRPIQAGDPIMIGLKTGFIVPSPQLKQGQQGFSLFAPGDGILTPEFYEQIMFLMREHAPNIEAALEKEGKSLPIAKQETLPPEDDRPILLRHEEVDVTGKARILQKVDAREPSPTVPTKRPGMLDDILNRRERGEAQSSALVR
jgi:hypothetical protein